MIVIVYFQPGSRNSELAQAVARGIEKENYPVTLMDAASADWQILKDAAGIVFGCPTYFGSIPAGYKKFLEDSMSVWQEGLLVDKIAAAFTDSSAYSGDKLQTLQQLSIFAMQHGMIWVGMDLRNTKNRGVIFNRLGGWLGLMAQSNIDPTSTEALQDNEAAEYFGKRIATTVQKMRTSCYKQ